MAEPPNLSEPESRQHPGRKIALAGVVLAVSLAIISMMLLLLLLMPQILPALFPAT